MPLARLLPSPRGPNPEEAELAEERVVIQWRQGERFYIRRNEKGEWTAGRSGTAEVGQNAVHAGQPVARPAHLKKER